MTEDEIKLWNLYNKTEGTPWNCVPAWRGMVGEGGPIGYWMTTVPATEDPIQYEKNVEYMMAAANQAPRLLERLMTLEKDLEDARIWQARFANDSEAYKQGVEDMIEGLVRYLGLLKGTVYNDKEVHLIEVILHQYRK